MLTACVTVSILYVIPAQPSFVVTPQDKVVGVGQRVSLRCEVTGNPSPAVFWNKESSQVLLLCCDNWWFYIVGSGLLQNITLGALLCYILRGLS